MSSIMKSDNKSMLCGFKNTFGMLLNVHLTISSIPLPWYVLDGLWLALWDSLTRCGAPSHGAERLAAVSTPGRHMHKHEVGGADLGDNAAAWGTHASSSHTSACDVILQLPPTLRNYLWNYMQCSTLSKRREKLTCNVTNLINYTR